MTNFIEENRYSLSDYELQYVPLTTNQPPKIEIVKKSNQSVEATFNLETEKVGLYMESNDLLIGTVNFGGDNEFVELALNQPGTTSGFSLGTNTQNQRDGGIGIIDIRDASRINTHYFYIGVEPMNLSFSPTTGMVTAEIRDQSSLPENGLVWYEKKSEQRTQ